MPAISSGKVLVTGANGFIAVWTVKALLEAGFSVRGAVRSPSKAVHLKAIFSSYGDKLEFAIVPDMVQVRRPLSKPRRQGADLARRTARSTRPRSGSTL